ncbi:MAG: hypothetical protein RJQ14_21050, partial [Marinoscillum sp.]
MDFKAFSQRFSDKIGGEYNDYDENQSIFIIPLGNGRFQSVIARAVELDKYNRKAVQITSRVCETTAPINYPEILEASSGFAFTNFVVEDGYLQVDTSLFIDYVDEALLEEAIQEVAHRADEWE